LCIIVLVQNEESKPLLSDKDK